MATMKSVNFDGMTITKAKAMAREATVEFLYEVFKEVLGEENVSMVDYSELSVCVGTRKDADGNEHEVNVNLAPMAKDMEERVTKTKTFPAYDRVDEAEAFEATLAAKIEKKNEALKKKQQKSVSTKAKKPAPPKNIDFTDEGDEDDTTIPLF